MNKKILMLILSVLIFINSYAETGSAESENVDKYITILHSSKSYDSALNFAKKSANKLNIKLDLRDLIYHKENGLSFTKEKLDSSGMLEFPSYIIRGRVYEENPFISIEYSSSYENLTKGYYIVVAKIDTDLKESKNLLKTIKKTYKNAYIKKSNIYVGCMF